MRQLQREIPFIKMALRAYIAAATLAIMTFFVMACGGGGHNPAGSTVDSAVNQVANAKDESSMSAAISTLFETTGFSKSYSGRLTPEQHFPEAFRRLLVIDQLDPENAPRMTLEDWYDVLSAKLPSRFPAGQFTTFVNRILADLPGARQRVNAGQGSRKDRAIVALIGLMNIGSQALSRDPTITTFTREKQRSVVVTMMTETIFTYEEDDDCITVCQEEYDWQTTMTTIVYEFCRRIDGPYGWAEACWDLPPVTTTETTLAGYRAECLTICHEQ